MLWLTLRQLKSMNRSLREQAAAKLGQSKRSKAVRALVATLLEDEVIFVRTAAANSLGDIGDKRAEPALVATLNDRSKDLRWAAAMALKKMGWMPINADQQVLNAIALKRWLEAAQFGDIAVSHLITVLKENNLEVQEGAAEALGEIGDARAVEPLLTVFRESLRDNIWRRDEEAQRLRYVVAGALGNIGDARAIEPLIAELDGRFLYSVPEAAKYVFRKLMKTKPALVMEPLVGAIGRLSHNGRSEVMNLLLEFGGASAVMPLVRLALYDEAVAKYVVTDALSRVLEHNVEMLRQSIFA